MRSSFIDTNQTDETNKLAGLPVIRQESAIRQPALRLPHDTASEEVIQIDMARVRRLSRGEPRQVDIIACGDLLSSRRPWPPLGACVFAFR